MSELFHPLFIVCPLVFLAGVVDAVAGGGGLISLPAYLVAGLPPHAATATNKCSSIFGAVVSAFRFLKEGRIHRPPGRCQRLPLRPDRLRPGQPAEPPPARDPPALCPAGPPACHRCLSSDATDFWRRGPALSPLPPGPGPSHRGHRPGHRLLRRLLWSWYRHLPHFGLHRLLRL